MSRPDCRGDDAPSAPGATGLLLMANMINKRWDRWGGRIGLSMKIVKELWSGVSE